MEFETPLLVPSISSRALGPIPYQETPGTRVVPTVCSIVHSKLVDLLNSALADSALLVSAYDIHYKFLSDPVAFRRNFRRSPYAVPGVLFIDSGWFEKTGGSAATAFVEGLESPAQWERQDYERLIDGLDRKLDAVIVSWDEVEGAKKAKGPSYEQQITSAQSFFGSRRRFASDILLKRPASALFHDFARLSTAQAENLRAFDIIGVTEKELGERVIDRLVSLAVLRQRLDDADVDKPIHVFGGLDPLYTPLYYAAGAEVFDGLSWLRYAFHDGIAVSRDSGVLLNRRVGDRWQSTLQKTSLDNLTAMQELTEQLRVFSHRGGDWSKIVPRGKDLQPIFEQAEARVKGGGGRRGK